MKWCGLFCKSILNVGTDRVSYSFLLVIISIYTRIGSFFPRLWHWHLLVSTGEYLRCKALAGRQGEKSGQESSICPQIAHQMSQVGGEVFSFGTLQRTFTPLTGLELLMANFELIWASCHPPPPPKLEPLTVCSGGSMIFLWGTLTPRVGVLTYYFANFFPKTAWKWKNLDPKGRPWHPLRSANGVYIRSAVKRTNPSDFV